MNKTEVDKMNLNKIEEFEVYVAKEDKINKNFEIIQDEIHELQDSINNIKDILEKCNCK